MALRRSGVRSPTAPPFLFSIIDSRPSICCGSRLVVSTQSYCIRPMISGRQGCKRLGSRDEAALEWRDRGRFARRRISVILTASAPSRMGRIYTAIRTMKLSSYALAVSFSDGATVIEAKAGDLVVIPARTPPLRRAERRGRDYRHSCQQRLFLRSGSERGDAISPYRGKAAAPPRLRGTSNWSHSGWTKTVRTGRRCVYGPASGDS